MLWCSAACKSTVKLSGPGYFESSSPYFLLSFLPLLLITSQSLPLLLICLGFLFWSQFDNWMSVLSGRNKLKTCIITNLLILQSLRFMFYICIALSMCPFSFLGKKKSYSVGFLGASPFDIHS